MGSESGKSYFGRVRKGSRKWPERAKTDRKIMNGKKWKGAERNGQKQTGEKHISRVFYEDMLREGEKKGQKAYRKRAQGHTLSQIGPGKSRKSTSEHLKIMKSGLKGHLGTSPEVLGLKTCFGH